jgi:segregation and condensation protein B
MERSQLKNIIEAALLTAGRPLSLEQLVQLVADEQRSCSRGAIRNALESLEADCAERGIELKYVASGYRFQVRQELAPRIARLWEERPPRYSRALLETLALIAYRQPITRGEIETIRGVSVSTSIMKTLQEREWVRVIGHRDVPGRPAVYGTTRQFLDYFNLRSLDELPALTELVGLARPQRQLDLGHADEPRHRPDAVGADGTVVDGHRTKTRGRRKQDDADTSTAVECHLAKRDIN